MASLNLLATGNNIRNLMDLNDMPMKALAQECNVTVQCVSKWLNGKSAPGYDCLKVISILFHVTIDDILVYEIRMSRAR